MRYVNALIPTFKEIPAQAESVSYQLLVRAGYIQQVTHGVYALLPLGVRVLRRIERIAREEIEQIGGQEVLMPILQPAHLWRGEGSGRWETHKEKLLQVRDLQLRQFCLGYERVELANDLIKQSTHKSYRQFPIVLHEFQKGFRNEANPKWGLVLSRELFLHTTFCFDVDELRQGENVSRILQAYKVVLAKCGVKSVLGLGMEGGRVGESPRLCTLSETPTEDAATCSQCGYAESIDYAERIVKMQYVTENPLERRIIYTPNVRTIAELVVFLGSITPPQSSPGRTLKTLIYVADGYPIAVLIPGDREVNENKVRRLIRCKRLELADEGTIKAITGAPQGFAGPVGFLKPIKLLADQAIQSMPNMITGANAEDYHILNVNLGRDFKPEQTGDIVFVQNDDPCPRCGNPLSVKALLELASASYRVADDLLPSFRPTFTDKDGREHLLSFGGASLDLSRITSAVVEHNHDEKGLIWPISVAPFEIAILVLDSDNPSLYQIAAEMHKELSEIWQVYVDDRPVSAGVKFNDVDLLGIPFILTIGERGQNRGAFDIRNRRTGQSAEVKPNQTREIINGLVAGEYQRLLMSGSHMC